MRNLITAGLALSAVFVALTGKVHAYVNYPWCVQGETRGMECVFSTKEQCAQDGRGRGFGTQCIRNPTYTRPSPGVDQHREELAPEQTREHLDVHEEVRPRRDPSAAIG
jgi:hypothetical protein